MIQVFPSGTAGADGNPPSLRAHRFALHVAACVCDRGRQVGEEVVVVLSVVPVRVHAVNNTLANGISFKNVVVRIYAMMFSPISCL